MHSTGRGRDGQTPKEGGIKFGDAKPTEAQEALLLSYGAGWEGGGPGDERAGTGGLGGGPRQTRSGSPQAAPGPPGRP